MNMLTHPATDPRTWRATTIDQCRSWYYPLSERCLTALDETIRQLEPQPRPTTELVVAETPLARCAADLQPALAALETGRGFAIIEAPPERYAPQQLQLAYWLVGQLLGRPVEQNVQGTLLYDVRDEGKDVRYGARFSVTSAETGFHTDNSFGNQIVDYVGLLCLNPAKSGGLNQVVSACTLHTELRVRHPDVLAILQRPFHIERRAGLRPGDAPTVSFPVLQWDGHTPLCRYLRYWIEAGHEKAAQPLTAVQKWALDILDDVLREPGLHVEFGLKAGDMFFINNRWILHNRSAFEDHAQPERRRHYVRLWLQRRGASVASAGTP
jgi:hypothetical protein